MARLLEPKIAGLETQVVKMAAQATAALKNAANAKVLATDLAAQLAAAKTSLARWQAVPQTPKPAAARLGALD